MRIISYQKDGVPGVGVVVDETGLVPLASAAPDLPSDLRSVLAIDPSLARVRAAVAGRPAEFSTQDIAFDPVIPEPHATWALALNYTLHIEETGLTTSREHPQLFLRMPIAQVGQKARSRLTMPAPPSRVARASSAAKPTIASA